LAVNEVSNLIEFLGHAFLLKVVEALVPSACFAG
jgi:hypothetical protein